MNDTIREQILSIRDSGRTNMLDTNAVQCIAHERSYYEMVCYIKEHRREYWHFIMTGEE